MRMIIAIWVTLLVSACSSSSTSTQETSAIDPLATTASGEGCAEGLGGLTMPQVSPTPPGPDAPPIGVPPSMSLPDVLSPDIARLLDVEAVSALVSDAGLEGEETVSPVAALANPEGAIVRICDRAYGDDSDFISGCMLARSCRFAIVTDDGTVDARDREELARALAPIETAGEALGLVALIDRNVMFPVTPEQSAQLDEVADFYGWQAYEAAPEPLEVEATDTGFIVRAPAYPLCGCQHHLVRVAYAVTRDGQVCRLDEPVAPLAYSHTRICVD